ncbi:MAG: aminoacyl-tRNA hydrolase [Pseudomonadota bacterium]
MYLVIGLGNPGKKYASTRHNAGFLFLDYLYTEAKGKEFHEKGKYTFSDVKLQNQKFRLVKPTTFMNLSGQAVQKVVNEAKSSDKNFNLSQNLIIIHDDVDLMPGQIKIKENGGDGGHNGIKDILQTLGADNFIRIRVGVGRPGEKHSDTADYVLDNFTKEEWNFLWQDVFPRLYRFINEYLVFNLAKARSRVTKPL